MPPEPGGQLRPILLAAQQTETGTWGSVFLLILLILINAFFAACEIAVITLNDAKVEKMPKAETKTRASC
jgi:putative hemolysin